MKSDRHKEKPTLVRMPEELKKRLKNVSKKHCMPMNSVMVSGIDKRVTELEKKDPI